MRNVIVTGASRGLGLGIARRLGGCGYCAIGVARRESDAVLSAMQHVASSGAGTFAFRRFDLNEIGAISDFVKSIRREFGPVYGLVNNAAIGTSGLLTTTQNVAIERTIRLNTLSPIVLTKYVARAMMAEMEGRVVNITSIVGSTGFSGLSVYGATKAALVGFTRSLARELGPLNITVNAIAPGFVDSDMTASLRSEQRDRIVRRSPLHRLVEEGDIATAVEFLLGEGGRNITGTVVTVDAGSTA